MRESSKNENRRPAAGALLALLVAVAMAASSAPVYAWESGFYLGAGGGRFDPDSEGSPSLTESGGATKLHIGYQLLTIFGLEVGLTNFADLRFDLGGGDTSTVENYSYYGRLNLQLPLFRTNRNSVFLVAGGGVHRWNVTDIVRDSGGVVLNESETRGTAPMYGAGILIRSQKNAALRFDYELYTEVGTANQTDLRLWTINIAYYY